MQLGDNLVLDETPNSIICEYLNIQQENVQQKSIPKKYFTNKTDERK